MATFTYQARSRSGALQEGELDAVDRKQAMLSLRGKGLQPVSLDEQGKREAKSSAEITIKNADIISFTEELSALLSAGLPLEPALASMEGRGEEGALKYLSSKLRAEVTDGIPFHKALEKVSPQFDQLYCNLVAAGEASGSLPKIMHAHAVYMREQAELKGRLIVAMIYPAILVLACVGVAIVFIFVLLPQISGLLESMDSSKTPIGIKLAEMLGDFLRGYWYVVLIFAVILVIGVKLFFNTEENKAKWDAWKLEIPFLGKVVKFGIYVQWLQTLSNLLSNGVPLVQALTLTRRTVQNRFFKSKLEDVTERVKDGIKLTSSMRSSELFPSSMVDLVAVADQTGKLNESVNRAARYYESKLSTIIKWFMSSFTIIILIGMALLVGVLCFTLLQAIYGSMENMKR